MKRRVLTIVLAVLLAVLGTVGVLIYTSQSDARAVAGQKAVTVLVAAQFVPAGTSAIQAQRQGMVRSETVPAASAPADAVRSITTDLSALVVSADVQPGQLLLRPMLVPATQTTGGMTIPPGMVAVTIKLCDAEAVAGNVHAGSHVAVFDTIGDANALSAQPNCEGPHKQQVGTIGNTRMVLPNVQVLSVGPASAGGQNQQATNTAFGGSGSTGDQGTELVTLAVNQDDTERAILLTETGLPYLALLNDSSNTHPDTALVPLFATVK